MIKIEVKGIDAVRKRLQSLPKELQDKAIRPAINKTAEKARAEINRAIPEVYAVKAAEVRQAVDLRRASSGNLKAVIEVFGSKSKRGRSANLIHFLAAVQAAGLIIINGWNGRFALSALLGIAVGGGLFELIYQLSKGKYIGGGDVRLGYGFGLLLADPLKAWMVISLASLLGTVWAVVLVFRGNYGFKSKLSFGPFLIIALIVVVLYGDRLWRLLYGGV